MCTGNRPSLNVRIPATGLCAAFHAVWMPLHLRPRQLDGSLHKDQLSFNWFKAAENLWNSASVLCAHQRHREAIYLATRPMTDFIKMPLKYPYDNECSRGSHP